MVPSRKKRGLSSTLNHSSHNSAGISFECTQRKTIFLMLILWVLLTIFVYSQIKLNNAPYDNIRKKSEMKQINHVRIPNSDDSSNHLHTMYSVSCDYMMMWQLQQSIVLDYSWFNVNQSGHLTRIVSGCHNEFSKIRQMSKTSISFKADIQILDISEITNQCLSNYPSSSSSSNNIFLMHWDWNRRFHVIFVPSFDDIKQSHSQIFGKNITKYAQLNRILALYIIYHCTDYKQIKQDFMMMIDPDFIFLKSLNLNQLKNKFGLNLHQPVAARYGLSNKWIRWLKALGETVEIERNKHYEAGVPYILHNDDWYNLIPRWIEYIPLSYANYGGIESDMYALMIGSYKLNLSYTLSEEFMSTCMKSMDQSVHPFNDQMTFIHYCSAYNVDISEFSELSEKVGETQFVFNKHWTKARRHKDTRQMQMWMLECASPLIIEIPKIERLENYEMISNDGKLRKEYKQYKVVRKLVPMFNNGLIAFKEQNCVNKSEINRDKRIILHEATMDNGDVLYHIVDDL